MGYTTKAIFLLVFTLCCISLLNGQHLQPPNPVGNDFLYEGKDGKLYISSTEGYYRTDGLGYELITATRDAYGALDPYIQSPIYPDAEGDMWYTGYTGLYRIDKDDEKIEAYGMTFPGHDTLNEGYHLFHLDTLQQHLWLKVDNHLGIYDIAKDTFSLFRPDVKSIRFNVYAGKGNRPRAIIGCLWNMGFGIEYMTQAEDTSAYWELKQYDFSTEFSSLRILSAFWLSEDEVLLASGDRGLFVFTPSEGTLKPLSDLVSGDLPAGRTLRFSLDVKENRVLFSESGIGVWAINLEGVSCAEEIQPILLYKADIDFFYLAPSGNLWGNLRGGKTGFPTKGITPLPVNGIDFEVGPIGVIFASITSLEDNLYAVTTSGTVYIKSEGKPWRILFNHSSSHSVVDIIGRGKALYLLTSHNVVRYNLEGEITNQSQNFPQSGNLAFTVSEDGFVLQTGTAGVYQANFLATESPEFKLVDKYRTRQKHAVDYLKFAGNDQLISVDHEPTLDFSQWTSGEIGKPNRFDIGQDINTVERTGKEEHWWVGTSAGLFLLRPDTLLAIDFGLQNKATFCVNSLSTIDSNSVLVGTTAGLIYYSLSKGESRLLTTLDNLTSDTYLQGEAVRSAGGKHWFLTNLGAVGIDIDKILAYKTHPPIAYLKNYWVNNLIQRTPIHGRSFGYRENKLNFNLANTTFDHPEATFIAHRLLAVDDSWSKVKNGQFIFYPDLAPGNYTLEYYGIGKNGQQGAIQSFNFVIDVPIWKRPKSIFLFIMVLLLSLFLLYERNNRRELRKRDAAIALEKEMTTFRQDFHDDVHDSLTGEFGAITATIDVYKGLIAQGHSPVLDVETIERHTRNGMDETRQMLAIYQESVGLKAPLVPILKKLVEEFAETINLRSNFNINTDIPPLNYSLTQVRHIKLIVKEGLTNIRRHAHGAKNVTLAVRTEGVIERRLLIELIDDGCGLLDNTERPSKKGYGIGKHSASRRAKKLNGTLKRIDLKPSGVKLQLSIPLLLMKDK